MYNPRFFGCVLSLTILYNLSKDANDTAVVYNPCAPRGHLKVFSSKYLWGSPCVKGTEANDTSHNVTGTGNYSLCATEVNKLFNFTSCAGNKNCSFDGVYLPPTDGDTFLVSSSPRVFNERCCSTRGHQTKYLEETFRFEDSRRMTTRTRLI